MGFFFPSPPHPGPALGPTQPPVQWLPGLKRLGREADHSPQSSAEFKNGLSYSYTPPVRVHDVDSFTRYFLVLIS